MRYTSIQNDTIKEIKKMTSKKYRDELDKFVVFGDHLVLEAFKAGYLESVYVLDDYLFPLSIKTNYVNQEIMEYLSPYQTPAKVLGICRRKNDTELGKKIVILDGVQDPGNLGTIIRSAVAFNFDTILMSEETCDIYNPKVINAGQGMMFHINLIRGDLINFVKVLKNKNYDIIGTKVTHGDNISSIIKEDAFAIVLGNEGSGISEEIQNLCDKHIYINMSSLCESLNVGVAASIILYELDK